MLSGGAGRAQDARTVALPIALLLGLTLIGLPFPPSEAKLDLRPTAIVEIDGQRDQRHPIAPDRAQQAVHLLAMEQQLARPTRLVIEVRRSGVLRYIGVDQKQLAPVVISVCLGDASLPLAQHLDFGAL